MKGLHAALFPSVKTQEKNICNTWNESRKNKFHTVWLVHSPPCNTHTPLGLPLFLPPLLAPVPPSTHRDISLVQGSPHSHWCHSTPQRNTVILFPLISLVNSLPARPYSCPHSWLTQCKSSTCKTQTLHQHSGNWEFISGLNKNKKKKEPKPKGKKKHLMLIMWRLGFCFLIQGSQEAKQKENI